MSIRRGYSFTEVMFAVVILGIGFIMIAAIFPAAIHQSKTTQEETTAATVARAAVQYLEQIGQYTGTPYSPMFPALQAPGQRGKVYALRDPQPTGIPSPPYPQLNSQAAPWTADQLWDAAKGSLISTTDSRIAWVGLYKRDPPATAGGTASSTAQVIIIACEVRNRSTYTAAQDIAVPAGTFANLQARPVHLTMFDNFAGTGVDRVVIMDDPGFIGAFTAASEGAFVVIADDGVGGTFNGHVYRLGALVGSTLTSLTFELQPGGEYSPDPGPDGIPGNADDINLPTGANFAEAFIVGRSYVSGAGTAASPATFDGLAQDVSVYTTFIHVK